MAENRMLYKYRFVSQHTAHCVPSRFGLRPSRPSTRRNKSGQFICYKTGQVYLLATRAYHAR